jgi:hypothetical protein
MSEGIYKGRRDAGEVDQSGAKALDHTARHAEGLAKSHELCGGNAFERIDDGLRCMGTRYRSKGRKRSLDPCLVNRRSLLLGCMLQPQVQGQVDQLVGQCG